MKEIVLKENKGIQITNEVVKNFIDYIDVSNKSIETYANSLKQFIVYLSDNNISVPTRDDIIKYRDYLMENHKPKTVNLYLSSVKNLYKWLEYNDVCKDITKNIKSISIGTEHLKRGLTREEINKVISSCTDIREELMIKLMITTALRVNEVANIRLQDFYRDSDVIMLKVLGKGRDYKQDSVKIDDRIFELIKEYCKEYKVNDYLFYSTSNHNNGNKVCSTTIRRIVNKIFVKSGIDLDRISPHSTRHTSCELALENGSPLQEVSQFMRHACVQTTMIYSKELEKRNCHITDTLGDVVSNAILG